MTSPSPPPTSLTSTTTPMSMTTAARTGPETSSQLTTNDLKNEKEEFISMEMLIGLVIGVALLVLVLLVVVIVLCCKKHRRKKKTSSSSGDATEKQEILPEKIENADSGNDSSTSLESPKSPERQSLLEEDKNVENLTSLIEASKPKFSSPVWLDEIQNNKIFNKQRSINTEGETQRNSRPFPVRSISEIIDSESEPELEADSPSNPPIVRGDSNGGESVEVPPSDSSTSVLPTTQTDL